MRVEDKTSGIHYTQQAAGGNAFKATSNEKKKQQATPTEDAI